MAQRTTETLIRVLTLIGITNFFSESSKLYSVALDESAEAGRQQRESFTKPKWKNYDFTMFLSRIITSRYIAVKWYLRVYWLLPFSIVASFKKNRRFFCRAPSILLLRIDASFGKHRRLFFLAPWILGPVNQLHFQKESFPAFTGLFFSSSTESADNLTEVILHQQTSATRPSCFFCWQNVHIEHTEPW